MSESIVNLTGQLAEFTDAEIAIMAETAELITSTRVSRIDVVNDCMRRIEATDDISRFVIGLYLQTYAAIDTEAVRSGRYGMLNQLRGSFDREKIRCVAPGVYWCYNQYAMHEILVESGEFTSYSDINDAARSLGFPGRIVDDWGTRRSQALDTVDHLVHWLAARYPDSAAVEIVRHSGTKTGKLVHGNTQGFDSWHLLFHETVLEDYVRSECMRGDGLLSPHKAVITLVATGDWDRALEFCTPRKRKQLSQ